MLHLWGSPSHMYSQKHLKYLQQRSQPSLIALLCLSQPLDFCQSSSYQWPPTGPFWTTSNNPITSLSTQTSRVLQGLPNSELTKDFAELQKYQPYEKWSQHVLSKTQQSFRNICQWELPRWTPDTGFKISIINLIEDFKEFKDYTDSIPSLPISTSKVYSNEYPWPPYSHLLLNIPNLDWVQPFHPVRSTPKC